MVPTTSSSRKPGTSQSKPTSSTCGRSVTGMVTVTRRRTGVEGVFEGKGEVALDPFGGEVGAGRGGFAEQEFLGEIEQVGVLVPFLLPPRVEVAAGDDIVRMRSS